MEVREPQRLEVAKPVPSRPACSSFRSFSELLAGAINNSQPPCISETTLPIRPKTVRFKPTSVLSTTGITSSQISAAAVCAPEKISKEDYSSCVVYKPLPKPVSRTALALLANMGNSEASQLDVILAASSQTPEKSSNSIQLQPPDCQPRILPQIKASQTTDPAKSLPNNVDTNQRTLLSSSSGDRTSYDGYNWRKYGQKQVKGSEYPRSYYKCTYPNCLVKKKVERSLDGQIAEIVYKGEHNHPKPQPPKRFSSAAQGQPFAVDGTDRESGALLWSNSLVERNDGSDSRMDSQNDLGYSVSTNYSGKIPVEQDLVVSAGFIHGAGPTDNSCGIAGDCEEGSKGVDGKDDEPKFKRRCEDIAIEVSEAAQGTRQPQVVVQTSTESDVTGDGFRWRKYGQKIVKGNPFPRSYYRCTNPKCNMRKHVERTSDAPGAFVTTYEGRHNHEMPGTKRLNSAASDPN